MASTPPTSSSAPAPSTALSGPRVATGIPLSAGDVPTPGSLIPTATLLEIPGYAMHQQQDSPAHDEPVDEDAERFRFTNHSGEDKSYLDLNLNSLMSMYQGNAHARTMLHEKIQESSPWPSIIARRAELDTAGDTASASMVRAYNVSLLAVKTLAELNAEDRRHASELIGSAVFHYHTGPAEMSVLIATQQNLKECIDIKSREDASKASESKARRNNERMGELDREALSVSMRGTGSNGSHRNRRRRLN